MNNKTQILMRSSLTNFFAHLKDCCAKDLLYGHYNVKEEIGNEILLINKQFETILTSYKLGNAPSRENKFFIGGIRVDYVWSGPALYGVDLLHLIQDEEKKTQIKSRLDAHSMLVQLSTKSYCDINNYTKLIKTFPFFEKVIQNNTNKILTSEVKGFVVDIPENYLETARKEFNYHTLVNNFVYEIDSTFRLINCTYKNMEKE